MDQTSAAAELVTVRDFLRFAVSRFSAAELGHGTTNAFDDAAFLVLEGLNLPVDKLDPWLDARLLPGERQRLAELIDARVTTRKPTAYLVGKAYIQGLPFAVDERVIVPRSYLGEMMAGPESDGLFGVGEGTLVDAPDDIRKILELCTGSGCLAIIAADLFPLAQVDAVDISEDALKVAERNVADYGMQGRIGLLKGDLFAPVTGRTYDLIIANPPYVAAEVVKTFPPEYAAEPTLAHLGGTDGFDLVRRIIRDARTPCLWLDSAESMAEVFWVKREDLP
jgi:ribosomal protein L3 glutamine methyltransferase